MGIAVMSIKQLFGGQRCGKTSAMAQRAIDDAMIIIVCGSETQRDVYLKMGVSLKQLHVVTGADVEKILLKKMHRQQGGRGWRQSEKSEKG